MVMMEMILFTILVAVGSATGAVARYWISGFVAHHCGESLPWGTFAVNVSGCLLIGVCLGLSGEDGFTSPAGIFLTFGLLGGYTTVSSFSLQTLNLLRERAWNTATLNIFSSVVICLSAVWLGAWFGGLVS